MRQTASSVSSHMSQKRQSYMCGFGIHGVIYVQLEGVQMGRWARIGRIDTLMFKGGKLNKGDIVRFKWMRENNI